MIIDWNYSVFGQIGDQIFSFGGPIVGGSIATAIFAKINMGPLGVSF